MKRLSEVFNKETAVGLKDSFMTLIYETKAEVLIGAAALGLISGVVSFDHEQAKRGQIPLGFSEIRATVLHVETLGGGKVPPLTYYYASINDVAMQVFEANNLSYGMWDGGDEKFAYELEKKIDPSMRIHTLISDYSKVVPARAQAAAASVAPITTAARDLAPVVDAFDKAWSASHHDVTHMQQTGETCSGEGSSRTCTPTYTEVYDYTINTYTYNDWMGLRAARLLQEFVEKHPDIHVNEKILRVTETNAENEWAIRQSRKLALKGKPLYEKDYMEITNMWATGSNYISLTPNIYANDAKLRSIQPVWDKARLSAHSERYITYTRGGDAGPEEYRIGSAALQYAFNVANDGNRLNNGIVKGYSGVSALEKKSWEYINVELHGAKGNGPKLRREVMSMARDLYSSNFAGGFDTQPSKYGMVVLWTMLGMAGGAALGYGADALIDRKRRNTAWDGLKRGGYSSRFGRGPRL